MMTLGGTTMTILPLEIRGKSKSSLKNLRLNSYEKMLCQDVVDPDDIKQILTTLEDLRL